MTTAPDFLGESVGHRVDLLEWLLGSRNAIAHELHVNRATVGRWSKGDSVPRAPYLRQLVDLDYIVARLGELWTTREDIVDWLTSPNGFLDGAKPIDVVVEEGPRRVLDAIDAERAGSYV